MNPTVTPRILVAVFGLLAFVVVSNNTAAAIAQPAIGQAFGAGPGDVGWVVFGFGTTFAIATALWGGLAARLGVGSSLAVGVLLFSGGSARCRARPIPAGPHWRTRRTGLRGRRHPDAVGDGDRVAIRRSRAVTRNRHRYRRCPGHGRRLWEHAARVARARGASALELDAEPNAIGFYERMGAVLIGTSPSPVDPGRQLPRMRIELSVTGSA
jgi:GNAT superfamily N-acetyltransferase